MRVCVFRLPEKGKENAENLVVFGIELMAGFQAALIVDFFDVLFF